MKVYETPGSYGDVRLGLYNDYNHFVGIQKFFLLDQNLTYLFNLDTFLSKSQSPTQAQILIFISEKLLVANKSLMFKIGISYWVFT
jgi:hypothetical protein